MWAHLGAKIHSYNPVEILLETLELLKFSCALYHLKKSVVKSLRVYVQHNVLECELDLKPWLQPVI